MALDNKTYFVATLDDMITEEEEVTQGTFYYEYWDEYSFCGSCMKSHRGCGDTCNLEVACPKCKFVDLTPEEEEALASVLMSDNPDNLEKAAKAYQEGIMNGQKSHTQQYLLLVKRVVPLRFTRCYALANDVTDELIDDSEIRDHEYCQETCQGLWAVTDDSVVIEHFRNKYENNCETLNATRNHVFWDKVGPETDTIDAVSFLQCDICKTEYVGRYYYGS